MHEAAGVLLDVQTQQHFRKHNDISDAMTFPITERVGTTLLVLIGQNPC